MKSFKGYLTEFAQQSTSDYVFDTHSVSSSSLKIPMSGPMFKRIWPDTIRTTVFHTTDLSGLKKLKGLEGGKKTISAFFSMMDKYMQSGIATGGGIVAEMDADVLVSAADDIMSVVDNRGRRWVELSWFANSQRFGTGPAFGKVEKDLNTLIANLVKKHLPKGKEVQQTRFFAHDTGTVFDIWGNMKRHLKDSKKLSLVIKDYFDGVEKIIKKNKEVMGGIFYGYAKSKRQTDNAWDEQIVNNIEIIKIHLITFTQTPNKKEEEIIEYVNSTKWPLKTWDASIDLEVYTRQVAQAEVRMMKR